MRLAVHWTADAIPTNNWRILAQLVRANADGTQTVVAVHNNRPGDGTLYTYRSWQPGRDILDEYPLDPNGESGVPAGEYELEISLFRSEEERFPAARPLRLGPVLVTE